uniref:Uncharacterized protein n=1 Tax=Arundo donax TaxID=35708 RepID=A0A0A9G8E9_ARUDO
MNYVELEGWFQGQLASALQMETSQHYPQLSFLYCLQWYLCPILWIHQLPHQRMQKEETTCLCHQATQQNAAFLFSGSPRSLIRNQQEEADRPSQPQH